MVISQSNLAGTEQRQGRSRGGGGGEQSKASKTEMGFVFILAITAASLAPRKDHASPSILLLQLSLARLSHPQLQNWVMLR